MMYNMPNDQNTSLAEKRSVQIAVLIFAICSAIWAAFFTHSYKAAIVYAIIVVCLREFYAKPYSALEEKKSPCFVRVMFVGTQVDTISCRGADSVCCPLSCVFSLFLLCGKLVKYLAQGRRNVRLRLALLHRAVHRADVAVHDADALVGAAGVFLRPLAHLNPLDEQP